MTPAPSPVPSSAPPPADPSPRRGQRLLFLAAGFAVLLTFPLLGAADRAGRLGGVPGVYLYVLLVWGALIGLTGWMSRGGSQPPAR